MLRVGLTGQLGSGKSTVARRLAELGAVVMSSDEMGRAMMLPGERVYAQIVAHFGPSVVKPDGTLDRRELARLAFGDHADGGRVEELNAIVHPAVLAEQARCIAELEKSAPGAIVVVESALMFSTRHAGDRVGPRSWSERFDCIVLVTAPMDSKVQRFVERAAAGSGGFARGGEERAAAAADGRRRLAAQDFAAVPVEDCIVIANDSTVAELEKRVDEVWAELLRRVAQSGAG